MTKGKNAYLIPSIEALTLDYDFRLKWAEYFEANNIRFAFFSATNAKALQESRLAVQHASPPPSAESEAADEVGSVSDDVDSEKGSTLHENSSDEEAKTHSTVDDWLDDGSRREAMDEVEINSDDELESESLADVPAQARARAEADLGNHQDSRIRVLSVLELEELFITSAPDLQSAYNSLSSEPYPLYSYHRLFTT